MKTRDFSGFLRGLAPFVDTRARADIEELASLCESSRVDTMKKLCAIIRNCLRKEAGAVPSTSPPPTSVEDLVSAYMRLESEARSLDFAEIDRRFGSIKKRTLKEVKALAKAPGYPASGKKADVVSELLRPLRKLREMQQRTDGI